MVHLPHGQQAGHHVLLRQPRSKHRLTWLELHTLAHTHTHTHTHAHTHAHTHTHTHTHTCTHTHTPSDYHCHSALLYVHTTCSFIGCILCTVYSIAPVCSTLETPNFPPHRNKLCLCQEAAKRVLPHSLGVPPPANPQWPWLHPSCGGHMDPAVCQGRPTSHLQHRWNQGEGWGGGS